jgi:aminoglycoside phosphotransferase (APT) family kinase protein
LRHFEAVGFDGAPRFIGIDEKGREVLSYVKGEAALAPVPAADDAVEHLGRLVRRMHDAQEGFVDRGDWVEPGSGPVICFHDYFPPNVIFRKGRPVALIDWDLARPGERAEDVAMAASWWVPLRPDEDSRHWGFPLERRGERLRRLCDGYGLDERGDVVEQYLARRRRNSEHFRDSGDETRLQRIQIGIRWLEEHRNELEACL